jgi:uncharacterized protein (TIGR02246 family)
LQAGYTAELRRGNCRPPFSTCVFFQAPLIATTVPAEELEQTFPAGPYLRKRIRFSGWLGAQGPMHGDVELRMRVDYADGDVHFFDSIVAPVVSIEPQFREVLGVVGSDAMSISVWARFHPPGPAWVSNLSFGTVEDWQNPASDEAIRALIRKFADLRNAHDGLAVAALYSENGEYSGPNGEGLVRGRQALATLWANVTGQVERTVESIEFPTPSLAVVHVAMQYAEPIGRHHETFIAVKENGTWLIRVHQPLN